MKAAIGKVLGVCLCLACLVQPNCATSRPADEPPVPSDPTPPAPPDLSPDGQSFLDWCRREMQAMQDTAATLRRADAARETRATLGLFNGIEIHHDDAINRAGLYELNHPDASVRQAALQCEQEASALYTDLMLDPDLYRSLAAVNAADPTLDGVDRRFLDKVLLDFRRNGVDREPAVRETARRLNQRMVELSQIFEKNLAEDTRYVEIADPAQLAGLPEDFIDAHKPDENGVRRIATDWPDWYPVMTYARDDALREQLWRLGWNLGYPKNVDVFKELLKTRNELAKLLGYPNWAAYATETMMIKSPEAARRFIERAFALSKPIGERDLGELLAFKRRRKPEAAQVFPWEKEYLSRLLKAERYQYDPELARSYFAVDKVQAGLLALSEKLFDIKFARRNNAEVWHPDVQAFDVVRGDAPLGRIYLDLYPRENKYKSFAMFSLTSGVEGLRLPEMAIVGNFADPAKSSGPALIDHLDVETFFHEFGHLLHGLLGGQSRYLRFSGAAAEWDFVETPSQLYEEWTWDPGVLAAFATNAKGEAIPAELVERMHAAEDFGKGLFVMQQMFYAAVSLGVYEQDPAGFDPDAYADRMQAVYSPWPVIEETHFVEGFGHLIGYASNYYTYMWSLVIEKDLFEVFKAKGLTNTEVSAAYRRNILEPGGQKDAADMVKAFLGRPFAFDAYEKWLNGTGQIREEREPKPLEP